MRLRSINIKGVRIFSSSQFVIGAIFFLAACLSLSCSFAESVGSIIDQESAETPGFIDGVPIVQYHKEKTINEVLEFLESQAESDAEDSGYQAIVSFYEDALGKLVNPSLYTNVYEPVIGREGYYLEDPRDDLMSDYLEAHPEVEAQLDAIGERLEQVFIDNPVPVAILWAVKAGTAGRETFRKAMTCIGQCLRTCL